MIRANSTLADARYGSVFPQGKQTIAQRTGRPSLFGAETFKEGIGGRLGRRLGRSDPSTPGVKFELAFSVTAARPGEDASGSVMGNKMAEASGVAGHV